MTGAMWSIAVFLGAAAVVFGILGLARLLAARRPRADTGDGEQSLEQRRQDMIFIWTEIHGVPRERAEAIFEEYERATTVASLGLKGK